MRHDKKVSGGEIKFVLAKRIGRVVWWKAGPNGSSIKFSTLRPSTLD